MATQIGELRARLTAEASQMKAEIQAVKKGILDLSEQAKKADGSFDGLNEALGNIGLNAGQIKKIGDGLRSANPQILEKQLQAVRDQLRQLGVDAKQIEKIEQEMKKTQTETEKSKKSMEGFGSAITAIGAGAAFVKLTSTIKSLADEAQQLSMAYSGLSAVSKSLNIDVAKSADLADELADRWGLSRTELANTVKTYLAAGLTLDQTKDIIIATADAAVYNKQANLSWAEAINQVAQGIKMGNSDLTDAAGITTNLSVMYDRYAKSIGTSAAKLTEAQKIQAAYNGMLQEGAMFAGNADSAMTGYTGTQATFNQTLQTARVEMGESFLPVLQDLMEMVTPIIREFALFADGNKEVVAGIGAALVAVTALIAVLGTLSVAITAVEASMGPIGWLVLAIGAAAAGISAYAFAANSASEASKEFAKNQQELNVALANSPANITADQYTKMQSNLEQLNEVLERRNELEKEYNDRMALAQSGQGSIENTQAMWDLADSIEAVDKELKDMDYSNVDEAKASLDKMKEASKGALGALVDLTKSQMQQTVAQVDNISQMKDLIKQYDDLNKQERLSEQQKAHLAEITKKLKEEYPDLLVQLDEENRWHIKNKEALDAYISGEVDRVNATADAAKRTLEIAKTEANERIRLAKETIEKIEAAQNGAKTAQKPNIIPDKLYDINSHLMNSALEQTKNRLNDQINTDQFRINEASKEIDDLTVKDWNQFRASTTSSSTASDSKKTKSKTLADIQQDEYQRSLKFIQYKRDLNQMSEQQELNSLQKLAERYKKNGDIRMDVEVKIKSLQDQMATDTKKRSEEETKAQYESSDEWIEQEERRLTLSGKNENEIVQMKLDAWTRIRNRYAKDSDYYKEADTQVYNLKVSLMKAAAKEQEDIAKQQEKDTDDLLKKTSDAISKAKQEELDALDERRKAIEKFYEDQQDAIDESERQRERSDLQSEIEKYRYATSEAGKKHLQELQENLRKMDVEDQKKALEDERDQKLEALDKQKDDIESWYDELEGIIDDYKGDAIKIYQSLEDERYKAFVTTNDKIRSELQTLIEEYNNINIGSKSASGSPSSSSSSELSGSSSPASVVAQMKANSEAWKKAASAADKETLVKANEALGASIGATKNTVTGKWTDANGLPLFHTGRNGTTGLNFRSSDLLMPDELAGIIKNDEYVFTPDQMKSLVGVSSSGTVVNIEKFMEVNEPVFEDGIDMRAFGREAGDSAADILRKKLTGGG